jgi:T-complex protein 1 subunit alpha
MPVSSALLTVCMFLTCLTCLTCLAALCVNFVAKTSMSSKILGSEAGFFSELAVNAALKVRTEGAGEGGPGTAGKVRCPISNIHILKAHGQSSLNTELVDGYALNCTRAAQGMPSRLVGGVKVALLDFGLSKHKLQLGVQVVLSDPKQAEEVRQREMDITKEKIRKILAAGAQVVLTSKGIDDLCLKYFVEAGVVAVRRVAKEDLKRIAKATGGKVVVTLADLEGNEAFDAACLGECSQVSEERVGDGELLYFRGCRASAAVTIVLRGANEYMLDEMDRSLHDALCVIKRMLESSALVAGGGAVEAAVSIYLEHLATSISSREQLAVAQFAEALLVIPRTLTINAAHDATDLVAKLRAHHFAAQTVEAKADWKHSGLDLSAGCIRDNLQAGVVEPAISKIKSLRFATEAAISILRIDDMITLNPAREQPGGGRGGR